MKLCILDPSRGECVECGECNICDLDPTKVCDNCGKCIGMGDNMDYRAVVVDGIITADMDPDEYLYDDEDDIVQDDDLVWP